MYCPCGTNPWKWCLHCKGFYKLSLLLFSTSSTASTEFYNPFIFTLKYVLLNSVTATHAMFYSFIACILWNITFQLFHIFFWNIFFIISTISSGGRLCQEIRKCILNYTKWIFWCLYIWQIRISFLKSNFQNLPNKNNDNTPGTRVGPGFCDRTLAIKSRKNQPKISFRKKTF